MLEKLSIKNFQIHSSFDLEFDKRITCIVGASDVGKSAVLRALKWVLSNSPSGDSFVKDGSSSCQVELEVDGKVVSRHRTPSLNRYLYGTREEFLEYKAFGSDVPEPIANFLNVGPTNFQSQHDPPFWLSDTAGQVSRNLNAVVNLDIIDRALSAAAKAVTKARTALELADERCAKARDRKMSLAWVKKAKAHLGLVSALHADAAEKGARVASLRRLAEEGVRNGKAVDGLRGQARALRRVVKAGRVALALDREVVGLGMLVEKAGRLRSVKAPNTSRLSFAADTYNRAGNERIYMEKMYRELGERTDEAWRMSDEAEVANEDLEEQMGGLCPLCGSEMGDLK